MIQNHGQKNDPGPPLQGKVALVTGASQSIGRAIVERLSRDGASVIPHYRNHEREAQEVVLALRAQRKVVLALQPDLTETGAIRHLFLEALCHFGRLDIVVANAGIPLRCPVSEVTEEQFDNVVAFLASQDARWISGQHILANGDASL